MWRIITILAGLSFVAFLILSGLVALLAMGRTVKLASWDNPLKKHQIFAVGASLVYQSEERADGSSSFDQPFTDDQWAGVRVMNASSMGGGRFLQVTAPVAYPWMLSGILPALWVLWRWQLSRLAKRSGFQVVDVAALPPSQDEPRQ